MGEGWDREWGLRADGVVFLGGGTGYDRLLVEGAWEVCLKEG